MSGPTRLQETFPRTVFHIPAFGGEIWYVNGEPISDDGFLELV